MSVMVIASVVEVVPSNASKVKVNWLVAQFLVLAFSLDETLYGLSVHYLPSYRNKPRRIGVKGKDLLLFPITLLCFVNWQHIYCTV